VGDWLGKLVKLACEWLPSLVQGSELGSSSDEARLVSVCISASLEEVSVGLKRSGRKHANCLLIANVRIFLKAWNCSK